MVKFSIIIPVYRVEQYLDQCLQSVVAQTYRDFEVILVDDGSPDNSGVLCDRWAEKDSRIRVIHQENQGLSGARNTGIRAATGDYLMFLDSDDWWSTDTVLDTVAARLKKTGADVLSFNYQKIYDSKRETPYFGDLADAPENLHGAASLEYMMDKGIWITGACNKAISRELAVSNELFFRMKITSEDIDWTLRLAVCAQRFDFINTVVFLYRQRSASISHSVSRSRVEGLCANVEECLRLLETAPVERAEMLKPFVAYQYATAVFNYAGLEKPDRTTAVTAQVKDLQYLLRWSSNPKVRAMDICGTVFGLSATVFLLRCWEALRSFRTGGTES